MAHLSRLHNVDTVSQPTSVNTRQQQMVRSSKRHWVQILVTISKKVTKSYLIEDFALFKLNKNSEMIVVTNKGVREKSGVLSENRTNNLMHHMHSQLSTS